METGSLFNVVWLLNVGGWGGIILLSEEGGIAMYAEQGITGEGITMGEYRNKLEERKNELRSKDRLTEVEKNELDEINSSLNSIKSFEFLP